MNVVPGARALRLYGGQPPQEQSEETSNPLRAEPRAPAPGVRGCGGVLTLSGGRRTQLGYIGETGARELGPAANATWATPGHPRWSESWRRSH